MNDYKNIFTSKTFLAILVAIIVTLCQDKGISLPVDVSPVVSNYAKYISLIGAIYFRYKATHKLSI